MKKPIKRKYLVAFQRVPNGMVHPQIIEAESVHKVIELLNEIAPDAYPEAIIIWIKLMHITNIVEVPQAPQHRIIGCAGCGFAHAKDYKDCVWNKTI